MRTFHLRGLAEGVLGVSTVRGSNIEDVFRRHPALADIRHKLTVDGDVIKGFVPCDG